MFFLVAILGDSSSVTAIGERIYNNENYGFISFKNVFSNLYAQLSEPTLHLYNHDGDCSPMVLLVGRI